MNKTHDRKIVPVVVPVPTATIFIYLVTISAIGDLLLVAHLASSAKMTELFIEVVDTEWWLIMAMTLYFLPIIWLQLWKRETERQLLYLALFWLIVPTVIMAEEWSRSTIVDFVHSLNLGESREYGLINISLMACLAGQAWATWRRLYKHYNNQK